MDAIILKPIKSVVKEHVNAGYLKCYKCGKSNGTILKKIDKELICLDCLSAEPKKEA